MQQLTGIFWLKGKPGAGKSTIMQSLYNRLREEYRHNPEKVIVLEFFFCAQGVEMQRTPLGMLRSLLNQLFRQDVTTKQRIREVYEEKASAFGHDERNWTWQRQELEVLLQDAILTAAQKQPVIIFIDALDEAGAQFASELANYFNQLANSANICISCRHYPVLSRVSGVEVWVENHNGDDIASFIHDRLDVRYLTEAESSDNVLWEDLKTDLAIVAAGSFQWTDLIVPLVGAKIVDGESPEEVRRWLEHVPEKLIDTYRHILQNIIKQEDYTQSFLLFQWLCLAQRPLSVTEMRYSLAAKDAVTWTPFHGTTTFVKTDERMKRRVKALSGGLAEIVQLPDDDKKRQIVRVIHPSVKSFLLTGGLTLLAKLVEEGKESLACHTSVEEFTSIDIVQRCHSTLYRSCLNYLITEETLIPTQIGQRFSKSELELDFNFEYSPWFEYATKFLFTHAEKAEKYRFEDPEQEIRLLRHILPKWASMNKVSVRESEWRNEDALLDAVSAANLTDLVDMLVSDESTAEATSDLG
jgi:ankyrin repeat domain-containing protein 50